MRSRTAAALALFALTALAAPPPVATQEIAAAAPAASSAPADVLAHLERTRGLFLAAIAGLTPEQWSWKPAPDRWSVAECAEHITRTEAFLREMARQAITEPVSAETLAKSHGKAATLLAMVVDRSQRFQAPEPLNPTQSYEIRAREAILRDFNFERGRTAEMTAVAGGLEAYAAAGPVAQEMDLAAWLYFISGHTERHTLQIEEVKATAGFPAG